MTEHLSYVFAASVNILISKQPAQSFTLSLTTTTHFTMIYLNIS